MTPDRSAPDREALRNWAAAAALTARQVALRDVPTLPTSPGQRRATASRHARREGSGESSRRAG